MNMKRIMQSLVPGALLLAGQAVAGVVGVPSTSGDVTISCSNPDKMLVVARTGSATQVTQVGPHGVNWQVELPPARKDHDSYWLSPDGSAAVVVTSRDVGKAFLVSGHYPPIEIDGGFVAAADFQKNRVLVATGIRAADGGGGTRVRVYATDSGELLGDSSFEDELAFTVTHDADKQFGIRLAEDGKSYYYIRWTRSAGDELVVRKTSSGRLRAIHDNFPAPAPVVNNTIPNVAVHDALLYADGGYVIAAGKLFAIKDQELVAIDTPDAMGRPTSLVESRHQFRQVVVGRKGWGVLDTTSGQWDIVERNGYAHLQPGDAGVTVVDLSRHTPGIRTWDVSGTHPRLVRSSAVDGVPDKLSRASFVCANAYGFMTYQNGRFDWHRTLEQP